MSGELTEDTIRMIAREAAREITDTVVPKIVEESRVMIKEAIDHHAACCVIGRDVHRWINRGWGILVGIAFVCTALGIGVGTLLQRILVHAG